MEFNAVELVKVGGPVFVLALVVIGYGSRHLAKLTAMTVNHLSHIEAGIATSNESLRGIATAIDRLVDRIDRMNDSR
ncbi:hypothetical protein LCGC14_1859390 [marine sediment metagenome]|uniref:Uncharacterized protein n=1 Tax=marine sediment metagenome TaxID=412755 RepID=A0A0F9G8A5_9ZZZZ